MPGDAENDLADVRAVLGGRGDAYARLIDRHQPAMIARMRRFARGAADLEELVHEVFVQAYLSLSGYSQRVPFEHWLARIGTRTALRHLKQRRRRERAEPLDDRLASADNPAPAEAAELLHGVLDQLPPRDRTVVTLLYLEEKSVAQAAALLGWTQTMVKVQAYRARGKLRRLIPGGEA